MSLLRKIVSIINKSKCMVNAIQCSNRNQIVNHIQKYSSQINQPCQPELLGKLYLGYTCKVCSTRNTNFIIHVNLTSDSYLNLL